MSTRAHKDLSFVDLFAGCGGLSLGLEQSGWQPVFVNELNEHAMETYLANREELRLKERGRSCHDIKELVDKDTGQLDKLKRSLLKDGINTTKGELGLVVGGPPCQGYSGIGHRRSYSVHKKQLPSNHLYEDMAEVIRALTPKMFLFENVRGLLAARWTMAGRKGGIWKDVLAHYRGLKDYEVRWELVYAKDYGVPQNRPRVLMVGIRRDQLKRALIERLKLEPESAVAAGLLPVGQRGYPQLGELIGDLCDPSYRNGGRTDRYPSAAMTPVQERLRTDRSGKRIFGKGDPLTEHDYSKHSPKIVEKFSYMLKHHRIHEDHKTKKFAQRVLLKEWGKGGPNITATSLSDDYVHYSQPRNLTVREWARLQMFPDWYVFKGKRTTGGLRRAGNPRLGIFDRELPKYTQIGNAVPVKLAQQLGEHFKELLGG